MKYRKKCLFLLLIAISLILPSRVFAFSGKVISIADGDTITVLRDKEQVRICFYRIGCPEKGEAFIGGRVSF